MNAWGVIAIGIALLVVTALAGVLKPTTLGAILIFVVVGMIFPPIAIWLGFAMLLYLVMAHGLTVSQKISSKVQGG